MLTSTELPVPDQESLAHSERVASLIRSEMVAAGGRLPFERYMDLALNAPGLGYYRGPQRRFGREGDYVTAPELSPLFGRCVARQVGEILEQVGGDILEVGAGSGRLCAQVLNSLGGGKARSWRYRILETGASLRQQQRQTIESAAPAHAGRVVWDDDLPAPGFCGVVICNELLDALPARRFRKVRGEILEACVAWRKRRFEWCYEPALDSSLAPLVEEVEIQCGQPLAEGYTSEVGPQRTAWVHSVGNRISRGALLLFDYGYPRCEYYHPRRTLGTLTCFFRHRAHSDPLVLPGAQDISVHVEFSSVAQAARSAGLEVAGFTPQAQFLLASGILDSCREMQPGTRDAIMLTGQIKRLTLPGEMGELIKVMALTRGVDSPLTGFSGRDLRDRV